MKSMNRMNVSTAVRRSPLVLIAFCTLLGCESSPFKDGSEVTEDPEQAVIDGNGPADGGAVGAMEPGIEDDADDVDQDPNIGAPM